MFNATFNNISAISWRSVSLTEETGCSKLDIYFFITLFSSSPHSRVQVPYIIVIFFSLTFIILLAYLRLLSYYIEVKKSTCICIEESKYQCNSLFSKEIIMYYISINCCLMSVEQYFSYSHYNNRTSLQEAFGALGFIGFFVAGQVIV